MDSTGKFGRVLGVIHYIDESGQWTNLNTGLINEGYVYERN